MRIIRLQAEGFKRLVAVDITPEGDLIEIRGNNGEGKSSVLDAIFATLAGKEAAPIKPVRTGEEYAIVRVDLGDTPGEPTLKVTRYFDDEGATSLKVENAEGATFGKAQTMLDALVGTIAFDPLEFARMAAKDQAAEIRRLVKLDVDLDALAAADRADYEARREVNRDAAGLKSRVEAIVLPAELPDKAPDKAAIVEELSSAAETNSGIERERARREAEIARIEEGGVRCRSIDEEIVRLEARIAELRESGARIIASGKAGMDAIEALPPLAEPVDTAEVRQRLDEAERVLAILARRDERARLSGEFQALKTKSEGLTAAMAKRAETREKALAAAKMPVDGLGFATIGDDLVVTFNGEPFSQASSAEQLRVSTAIAMAANPKLRVIIARDGSLLDKNSLAMLREIVAEHDFQLWGEFVGDDGPGIIMEAGAVRGAPEPERVEPPKRRKKKGEEEAEAAMSRGTSPIAGDMVQSAHREPDEPTATNTLASDSDLRPRIGDAAPKRKRAFDAIETPKPADGKLL